MRLEPIEKPQGWMMRAAYWMSRRTLGKVPSVLKVVYNRAPALARAGYANTRARETLTLDAELVQLVMTQSSMLNGCRFCLDLHEAEAIMLRLGPERFRALSEFRNSDLFDDRERAALAYTEEVTRSHAASDATFADLRKHFSERQIVELTWLNALTNFYNLIAGPLGLEGDGLSDLARARAAC